MSNKKSATSIICAVSESGTVGVKTSKPGFNYIRFTKLPNGNIAVCFNNEAKLSRVTYPQFVDIANAVGDHIQAMHA